MGQQVGSTWRISKKAILLRLLKAVDKNLEDAPAFVWWVPYVLKKRSRIISAVTKRYHKRTHKFGIEVPKSWDEYARLDKENNNTLMMLPSGTILLIA
jgi:hypothetical protein